MIITPYLPKEAVLVAKAHVEDHRLPAFTMAVNINKDQDHICLNCGGIGAVSLRLAKAGPLKVPGSNGQVVTWFDGNEQYGKGWYVIDKTLEFACPECQGK